MTGIARQVLYRYRDGELRIDERVQAVLSPVIRDIEDGRIRFRRRGGCGPGVPQPWEIEYREPALWPPPQPRVIPASDYNEWARCRSCGSPRFSRFIGLASKPYFACDGCVGPADRQMLGAHVR